MLSIGQTLATAAGLRQRKKFLFDVTFNLQDLLNCTYVSGVLFVKIRLKDGGNFSYLSRRYARLGLSARAVCVQCFICVAERVVSLSKV